VGRHGRRGSLRSGRRGCHFCSRPWPVCVSVRRPSPFVTESQQTLPSLETELVVAHEVWKYLSASDCNMVCDGPRLVSLGGMFLNRALDCTGLLAMIRSFDRALLPTKNTASTAAPCG
jgi:hypothetical protein